MRAHENRKAIVENVLARTMIEELRGMILVNPTVPQF